MAPDDWIRHFDAAIEYYLGIDPDKLTDEQWAEKAQNLYWIRQQEAKSMQQ